MKTYSTKSNCTRAAKKALGSQAKHGVDFDITGTEGGYSWHPREEPPVAKRKKSRSGVRAPLYQQPRAADFIRQALRPDGVTIKAFAEKAHVEEHTVRSMLSRLRQEIPALQGSRDGRVAVFKLTRESLPDGFPEDLLEKA